MWYSDIKTADFEIRPYMRNLWVVIFTSERAGRNWRAVIDDVELIKEILSGKAKRDSLVRLKREVKRKSIRR